LPGCPQLPEIHSPTPVDIAAACREKAGFVWLDSSSEEESSFSLLGWEPDLLLEGGADAWHLLEQQLDQRTRRASLAGIPDGAAVGYFRFDGSFRFAFYDQPLLRTTEGWSQTPLHGNHGIPVQDWNPPCFRHEMSRGDYLNMVRDAKEYVAAGDVYQVCLAHRFSAMFEGDPWPLYLALRNASPAPHAAFLKLGDETVLSSSPECFLKISGRRISTRPIKGTRPRELDPAEDERQAAELATSPKEIAELVMITDLERNDLGRVCEYGSVTTSELLRLERYAQVFHLVSTVEGRLRTDVSHVAAVAACFPGGSISGAPKKRSLEIIQELEPVPRGLFTGAIGYFGYNGESQFNIAIRTVVIREGRAEFHVGAGITADSDPEMEWEETLHKASGILRAASLPM